VGVTGVLSRLARHPEGPSNDVPPLRLTDVSKRFRKGAEDVVALDQVSLDVARGEVVVLLGRSGSGKSTLLHVSGGLTTPDAGSVRVDGADLARVSTAARTRLRRRRIGFVFQFFHLLPGLTVLENVALPLVFDRAPDARARAAEMIERVGMSHRITHYPAQMSGGEMQRTAVARALVTGPGLVLADEPTGNLDSTTGRTVADLLFGCAREANAAVIVATHDRDLGDAADRVISLADGKLR
jgi:ABC-type lipoprotein export system ATPase subunit